MESERQEAQRTTGTGRKNQMGKGDCSMSTIAFVSIAALAECAVIWLAYVAGRENGRCQ